MALRFFAPAYFLAFFAITWHPQAHSQSAKQDPSQASAAPPAKKAPVASSHNSQLQEEGERIFQQNCSRCHWAPDGFSSRISGTIVRHMRVRASLSQHDAEELMRFLNP